MRRADLVEYRRAFDSDRGLVVARKICYRRLVEPSSGVDVHGIDDFVCTFASIERWITRLELACRCKEKAAIWRESQSPEERRECLIGVNVGVPDARGET